MTITNDLNADLGELPGEAGRSSDRAILGRSWGCPALERADAERIIPLIKGGTFLYAVGMETRG